MIESSVCFINTASKQERIQVADAQSAEILRRVLAQLQNQTWVIENQVEEAPRVIEYIDSRRHDQRGAKEFRVVLISGNSTFRSGICDVSLEGLKLKNSVPAGFNQTECLAYISHHDMRENIELSCEVSTDADGVSRLQFLHPEKPELEKLSAWISEEVV